MKKLLGLLIMGFVIYSLFHYSVPTAGVATTTVKDGVAVVSKPDLEVISTSSENDGYIAYSTGVIKNNTSHNYTYVQITINEYDSSGNQIGSTLANTNNLDAGGTWKYKAMITDKNTKSLKCTGITGI